MVTLAEIGYSFFLMNGVFGFSTLTAYLICTCFNQPFINPKYSEELITIRGKDAATTICVVLVQGIAGSSPFMSRIWTTNHTWYESVSTMCLYSVLIELMYYTYHRSVHSNSILYRIHKKHHMNYDVYPFDTFYLTTYDSMGLIVSLAVPLVCLRVTPFELTCVLYMYLTSSYLSHSQLFYDHHHKHHTLLKCNFCFLFPIFDILCNTYQ